jgi:hypothetical protein
MPKSPLWLILMFGCGFAACKKTGGPDLPVVPTPVVSDSLRLITYSYKPGNMEHGALDTFNLFFNHSVTINSIQYMNSGCLPDFRFNTTDGGKTVQFYNFLCGGLGNDYTFKYIVTDSAGKQHSDTVNFRCYTRKIDFTGTLSSYFISKDNQYCWVLTASPNQMVQVGIADTGYRKTIPLSFVPIKAVFNYDNNKIYILPGDYVHRDSVYVMEPSTGSIVKQLFIPRIFGREEFGEDLAFGANGYGMLQIADDNYNPGWLVIDSRNNDTLYHHPSLVAGYSIPGLFSFTMCYPNFDGSKVIGLETGGSCRLVVLDCNTHELSELAFPPSPSSYSSYFLPNKLKDQLFMVNLQSNGDGQFFVSGGSIIGTSNFDAYGGSEADFSYRANENNYIYYFDNHVFGVVNYAGGKVLSMYGFELNMDKIKGTTDGRYLISRRINSLVLFDTGIFY